jgi:uncharacterized membrane protein
MKIMEELKSNFGKNPLCNGRSERAPYVLGKCFFLCWRCTMVMVFTVISSIILDYIDLSLATSKTFTILGNILILPMILDGGIQYFAKLESTNVRRAITGALFGIGIAIVAFQFVEIIK